MRILMVSSEVESRGRRCGRGPGVGGLSLA